MRQAKHIRVRFICLFAALLILASVGSAQFRPAPPNSSVQYPAGDYPHEPGDSSASGVPMDAVPGEYDPSLDAQHFVARLSLVGGEVNIRRNDGQTVAAAVNAPLVSQDHVVTGNRSSAEIQLDSGTVLRLAENSDLAFADLQNSHFQAQLYGGSVNYRVLHPTGLQGEIDTPSIAIHASSTADLRVYLLPDDTSQIAVRSGEPELLGPNGSERLQAGHSYLVRGNPSDPEFQETSMPALDTFDSWSIARDAELFNAGRSAQYIGPDIPGAADLETNGNWVASSYGQVWQPNGVAPDWAPYSYGHWVYQSYYGWTWIDYSPWGWAPYHYGRWFFNPGYGWCWWPGSRAGLHYWSPALVGFFGWRGGYHGLGWAPLAPYERFHPWWGRQARNFGYSSSGSVVAAYRNAGYRGGAHFTPVNSFGGPNAHYIGLSRDQLVGATAVAGHLSIAPRPESYHFAAHQAFPSDRFVNTVVRPMPNSFARAPSALTQLRSATPGWSRLGSLTPSRVREPKSSSNSDSGWSRFGDPGASMPKRQAFGESGRGNGPGDPGWHSFGHPMSQPSMPRYQEPRSVPQRQNLQAPPQTIRSAPSSPPRQSWSPPGRSGEQRGSGGGQNHSSVGRRR